MIEREKVKQKSTKICEMILLIIFGAQILFLMCLNIVHMPEMVDYDSSCTFMHVMEMWKQKTLAITEWGYQTTTELDSLSCLVLILYGITKNIFLSQALADNLIILFYIYVLYKLFKSLNISKSITILGMIVFFVPYSVGQLGYTNMLFIAGAFYSLKVLIPILLLGIILEIQNNRCIKYYIGRLVVLVIASYLCGLSSGVYVLLCGIVPIILYEIIECIITDDVKHFFNKRVYMCLSISVVMIFGILSGKVFKFSSISSQMSLVDKSNWIDTITSCFVGIYELLGGVASDGGVALFSEQGISVLMKWILTTLIIISIIYCIVKSIKDKRIERINGYAFSIISINLLVLTLLATTYGGGNFEYRYHILPIFWAFILFVEFIDDIRKSKNNLFRKSFIGMVSILLILSCVVGDIQIIIMCEQSNNRILKEMNSILENEEVKTAIIVGDENVSTGRVMRVFSQQIDYIMTNAERSDASATFWGGTKRALDNAKQEGKVAIITQKEKYDELPSYLKKGAIFLQDCYDLKIFLMDNSKFDFVSGLPEVNNESIDYPYSPGYEYKNASINGEGKLVSDGTGGIILWGPYVKGIAGMWEYTINYNIVESNSMDDAAIFAVTTACGENEIASASLVKEQNSITLQGVELTDEDLDVEHRISVPDGMKIEIESIVIRKSNKTE